MDSSKTPKDQYDFNALDLTLENIKTVLGTSTDIKYRNIKINNNQELEVALVYIDGLINSVAVSDFIIKPLITNPKLTNCQNTQDLINAVEDGSVYYVSMKKRQQMSDVINDILSGNTVIVLSKEHIAYAFDAKGFEKRGISEPTGENVIKGAKDAFVELLRTNTATCRRKIKSPYLTFEETVVGKQSNTTVAIVYLSNIAKSNIIDEVKKRLSNITIDRALNSGYIEEFLVDNTWSPFPQILSTERPDRFCSSIVDGRVGIIVDGLPIAYIVPGTMLNMLQAPEDYSQHFLASSAIRIIRYCAMAITLLLPAFYVSITSFHQEMIPTELTFSIISAKEGVPFPMFVEVILMLVAFELLVEAGVRLPKTIGQTVSIVGALVVGQAAVEAKLVSPATVVIIAITAISSFIMPNQDFSNALRLWRLVFVILSSVIGIFGMSFGLILLLNHLCRMESFGVAYLDPFVANEDKQMQDTLIRMPLYTMKKRPAGLEQVNKQRME